MSRFLLQMILLKTYMKINIFHNWHESMHDIYNGELQCIETINMPTFNLGTYTFDNHFTVNMTLVYLLGILGWKGIFEHFSRKFNWSYKTPFLVSLHCKYVNVRDVIFLSHGEHVNRCNIKLYNKIMGWNVWEAINEIKRALNFH